MSDTTIAPCHKCGEHEIGRGKLVSDLHPGIAFILCEKCNHRGPALIPPRNMSQQRRRRLLQEVIDAWNAEQAALASAAKLAPTGVPVSRGSAS